MNYLDLSPEYIARVLATLTRPMTALEFADLFWPERAHRSSTQKSQGGHALLNTLVRNGLVKRMKSKRGPDTFRVPSKKAAVSILPSKKAVEAIQAQLHPSTFYWVLLLHEGERWAWLAFALRDASGGHGHALDVPPALSRSRRKHAARAG